MNTNALREMPAEHFMMKWFWDRSGLKDVNTDKDGPAMSFAHAGSDKFYSADGVREISVIEGGLKKRKKNDG